MTSEQLALEIYKLIKDDDTIQDESLSTLGHSMEVFYHKDILTTDSMPSTHCNIFADGEDGAIDLTTFGCLIIFTTPIMEADVQGNATHTGLNLSRIINRIRVLIGEECDIGLVNEKGFEVVNYSTSNTLQDGQGNVSTLLNLVITQTNKCL